MKVAIACGGTGGHIFPGVAVAEALQGRGHEVVLWLSGREVEGVSLETWKGKVVSVKAAGFPAGVSLRSLVSGARLGLAFLQCVARMRRNPPDVLLAMGSYASVAPALAARMLDVPVVLHEANAIPGRAVTFLARLAAAVAVTFENTRIPLRKGKPVLTGFPVRKDIRGGARLEGLQSGLFTVLVTGGSQGARRLNEVAWQALCRLHSEGVPVQVVHLSGSREEAEVRRVYAQAGVPGVVFGFLKEMGRAYSSADLIIARSGAATCTEIRARAVPALLVPLATSMRGHQEANARAMEKTGGVGVMLESELTKERLADFIRECQRNPARLAGMKKALQAVPVADAAERIADMLEREAGIG